ncbi:hypothetical protein WICPIJ_003007 [Wickerhamomyces pijperi]|uniref:Altered inheritance of mitochondria protein 41 n=1 Tax=Wickerhamomyces pijperi TaxID=599730 RepID=A0A9P8QAI8_WICPI|nr:hypothetical protein WICPIJ_003007 [Wickerhamomyces pijperi]
MFSRTRFSTTLTSNVVRYIRHQSTQHYKDSLALLKTDLKKSMLAKDTVSRDTIKGLLSSIKNKEIDTKPDQHNEFLLFQLFSKSISQRLESAKEYESLQRSELAEKELKEVEIIKKYLHALPVASQEEVESKVKELLTGLLAENESIKLGQVYGKVNWEIVKNEWNADEKAVKGTIAKLFKELEQAAKK